MKPAQDPISEQKAPDYERDAPPRRYVPETSTPGGRGTEELANPPKAPEPRDNFNAPNPDTRGRLDSGTGSGRDSGFFEESTVPPVERLNNKPAMPEMLEENEIEPVEADEADPGIPADGKTFLDDVPKSDNTTFRGRDAIVARTSSLSEVITPKRLASRSLPSIYRPVSQSTLADKSDNSKSESPRPLRWISAPLSDGHVQL